jgi:YVTN family beta-propeller protein
VAVSPAGATAYITDAGTASVSVIDTATNTVTGTIAVGAGPRAVAFTPDGTASYVANGGGNSVSVVAASALPVWAVTAAAAARTPAPVVAPAVPGGPAAVVLPVVARTEPTAHPRNRPKTPQ